MNTLYITADNYVIVNQNGDIVRDIPIYSPRIRRLFFIKEDTKVQYSVGSADKTLDAKAGDIVLERYDNSYNGERLFIVNNKEWAEAIMQEEEAEQEAKEKWASLHSLQDKDCKCAL